MSKKPFDIKQYIQNNKFELEREINTGKNVFKGYNDIRKTLINEVKVDENGNVLINESLRGEGKKRMSEDTKRHFLEIISTYNTYREQLNRKSDLVEISQTLGAIVEAAKHMTLEEADDWFDKVTIKRNMKQLENLDKEFDKIAKEAKDLDTRMLALYEDMGHILNRYYEISDINEDEMHRRLGEKKKYKKKVSEGSINENREYGFDLTNISAKNWKSILKMHSFNFKPKLVSSPHGSKVWKWVGDRDLEMYTANDPISGKHAAGHRDDEKGYASYIGITGKYDNDVEELAWDIERLADYIKGKNKKRREFI